PFLASLAPGSDSFPEEQEAAELAARLAELGRQLRTDPRHAADGAGTLLAPTFRGGRLEPVTQVPVTAQPALHISRSVVMAPEPALDAPSFGTPLRALVEDFRTVTVAECLITAIEADREKGLASTDVRYDIVGAGRDDWRVERSGTWRLRWRRGTDGWRVTEWTGVTDLRSGAPRPVFAEVTTAALGGIDSFRRQLGTSLDTWSASIDGVLTRDSNGHHGVAVGDADGDGLDDLYVAQPSGLPNRLYR